MTHFRECFDSPYIGSWDLEGDTTVTIASVKPGTVEGEKGRKDKKAIVKLREFEKPWVCNVTNSKTIAGMYGAQIEAWVGKRVTLYATTTKQDGETKPCIRVRQEIPKETKQKPKGPIASATTAAELEAAIAGQAARISAEHEKAWPIVLERCKELGLSEERALEVLAKAAAQPEAT